MSESIDCPAVPLVDCSPEAQLDRVRLWRDLRRNFLTGVQQVTDRNRTVIYRTRDDMAHALAALKGEYDYCSGSTVRFRPPRNFYIPQVKDL